MSAESLDDLITVEEAAAQLGISTGKVNRLVEEHSLFVIKKDKKLMLPKHIIQNGEPLASLRGTILVLLDVGLSESEAIEWLYQNSEELGETPMSALLRGHKAPVRRIAQAL